MKKIRSTLIFETVPTNQFKKVNRDVPWDKAVESIESRLSSFLSRENDNGNLFWKVVFSSLKVEIVDDS